MPLLQLIADQREEDCNSFAIIYFATTFNLR
jgi:hypothetical protein